MCKVGKVKEFDGVPAVGGNFRRNAFIRVTALISVCIVTACSTVPVTGRRSLSLVSDGEMARMSVASYQQILDESELSHDQEAIDRIRRVGDRLAGAAEAYLRTHGFSTEHFAWEFNLIEDDEMINAWAMPGGKVAVYTGILEVAQDDAGLAAVMGHEISHVLAKHGNERMSQGLLVNLGGMALSTALSQRPGMTSDLFMLSYGAGTKMGVLLPYSRLQESEADRIGIILMAIAGYDPRAAIGFWSRMSETGASRPPQFLSTHPLPATRIRDLQRAMPEAMAVYEGRR